MNSKRKGSQGEREIVQILRDHGLAAYRGDQRYVGGYGNPDVLTDIAGKPFHLEVKRAENLRVSDWLAQVIYDIQPTPERVPAVVFRRNRDRWWIIQPLESFLQATGAEDCSASTSETPSESKI